MYKRQVLVDQSPMSIKQVNDNFSALFLKLSGNIDTIDLRDDAVDTDKIKDNAVTGDKVLDGSLTIIHLEDDFVSGLDLLDNPIFTSLSSTVDGNRTLIQQNKDTITLQASRISSNASNISKLNIRADGILAEVSSVRNTANSNTSNISKLNIRADGILAEVSSVRNTANSNTSNISKLTIKSDQISASVSSLSSDMGGVKSDISSLTIKSNSISASVTRIGNDLSSLEDEYGRLDSEVNIIAGEISSKVSWTDFDGETIVSEINQSPSRIKISARNIDLEGITTIYSSDGDSYVSMGNRYGEMRVVHGRHEYFSMYYALPGVEFQNDGYTFMRGYEDEAFFPGEVTFSDRVTFNDRVYFDGGGVVVPRRSSDVIELDVWSSGLAVYRDGSHIGTVSFN